MAQHSPLGTINTVYGPQTTVVYPWDKMQHGDHVDVLTISKPDISFRAWQRKRAARFQLYIHRVPHPQHRNMQRVFLLDKNVI